MVRRFLTPPVLLLLVVGFLGLCLLSTFVMMILGVGVRPLRSDVMTQAGSAESGLHSEIGETYGITRTRYWPCGSTEDALDRMLMAPTEPERKRIMVRTGSIGVTEGLHVKLLATAFRKRQILVLGAYMEDDENHMKRRLFTEDPRARRVCWVQTDALTAARF